MEEGQTWGSRRRIAGGRKVKLFFESACSGSKNKRIQVLSYLKSHLIQDCCWERNKIQSFDPLEAVKHSKGDGMDCINRHYTSL